MPLLETEYCSKPISVPPRLPMILKQFCKAAIRTQPYDLLKWSSAYFRALAEGIEPPTKVRLEYPLPGAISGLTLGFLKVLLRQFGDYNKILSIESILRRWDDLCLDRRDLNLIMVIGKFRRKCQVKKFLAIAVGLLGSSLYDTMLMVCELFTLEPDGGSAMVPISLFMEIYGYLAGLRCDGGKRESPVEDPADFLVLDPLDLPTPQPSEDFGQRAISLTSQDTETETDLEALSKKESVECVSEGKKQKIGNIESINEIEAHDGNLQQLDMETRENDSESRTEETISLSNENNCDMMIQRIDETLVVPNDGHHNCNWDDQEKAAKRFMMDLSLMSHYPNIPGIGPRLSPEDVASVAVWMTECAQLQEGMVGPRNLRHFQCPPLDRHERTFS